MMRCDNFDAVIATPLPGGWRLGVRLQDDLVQAVEFLPAQVAVFAPDGTKAQHIAGLLSDYFQDPHVALNKIPIAPARTAFQARVREAMLRIPAGKTCAYGELAAQIQTASRAVAGACRANPVPLVVPCHRVVAASGLGGFMGALGGAPLELKAWLLKHESV